ncbi:hypothetical protein Mapa_005824 [Marchantia paleacea]|nr:hypothetical protein Mapa_005824 [Marchantia paleacea]
MSYYHSYGSRYDEGYGSEKLEYNGYDDTWVLGVQTAATPYVHERPYSSRRTYGSGYSDYGSSYGSRYPPRSSYGSSSYGTSRNLILYPHTYQPQPSILGQLFPGRRHSYSSSKTGSYPDEVKLKVEICCLECKRKMLDSLRKMSGVYDVRVEGTAHAMVTVTGYDLKPKKILKKTRKVIKAADYWSDWHFTDGVAPHRSGFASSIYAPAPALSSRHLTSY